MLKPVAAFCSFFVLASCSSSSAPAAAAIASPVLHAYDVPSGMQADIASTLNNLLWRGEGQPKVGNVGVAPNGQVLVSAPAEFHPGVKELVEHMKQTKADPPPALGFDVWLVMGSKGDKTAGADVDKEIADVIDELQTAQGPLQLELMEHTRLQMTSGSIASAQGLELWVETQATISGDGVLANLQLRRRPGAEGRLDVRTVLPLGKTIVLGQVGAVAGRATDNRVLPATAFYVVRASKLSR